MKSWKEYPHLFWKFICLSEVNGKKAKHYVWWILSNDKVGFEENWIDSCTLIARKIEDMTDKELLNMPDYRDIDKEHLLSWLSESQENMMTLVDFLYLLSIGVYPFDQSHFGTEVIDIKTL